MIKSSLLCWKFRHVKVHQDDSDTYNNVYEWGKINIEADRISKYYMRCQIYAGETHQPHEAISGYIWPTTMEYHNVPFTITSHLAKTIKKIISKHRILKYWSSHNRDISNELIEVSVFQHAAKNLPIWQQRWLLKWSYSMCGVGKWLKCWKYQNHSKCRRCLIDNKTVDHIIHCPHQYLASCWSKCI